MCPLCMRIKVTWCLEWKNTEAWESRRLGWLVPGVDCSPMPSVSTGDPQMYGTSVGSNFVWPCWSVVTRLHFTVLVVLLLLEMEYHLWFAEFFVLSGPTSLSGCVGSLLAHGPLSVQGWSYTIHLQALYGNSVCSFSVCVFKALLVLRRCDFTLHVITRTFPSYSSFSLSLFKCDPQKTIYKPTQDMMNAGHTH